MKIRKANPITRLRWLSGMAGMAAALCVGVTTASAHVVVSPDTPNPPTAGGFEQYTMRVPCEKSVPTVKIVLKLPKGASWVAYEPVPGWKVSESQVNGQTLVTWQATNGGIQPGQFQSFSFLATNPKQPGVYAWDAFQYYRDGSIVPWTGEPGSPTPHSTTQIVAAGAQDTASSPSAPAPAGDANDATPQAPANFGMGWTTADFISLAAAIVSLILGVTTLVLNVRRDLDRP
ncbi:YcnI family protein [Alicyclobacillus vulcanalis]|uniref:Domain of unkown function n=1 Tax=Alicyclobacillus vulcanalis TaxID=252246 RepID=A0A1N7JKJ8_9BACL|nr:YcnI family protein [Alicyclobacillus vulcanalis]SIS49830.1 Domain of unkown function [Alicyclobacillus vulcanalis]